MSGKHRKQTTSNTGRFVAIAAGTASFAALGATGALPIANADATHDWSGVAQCESSGNWNINTGNGFYGGLQFTQSTWDAYKPAGAASRADLASIADQVSAAENVLVAQGIGAWPVCGANLMGGITEAVNQYIAPAQAPAPDPVVEPVSTGGTGNSTSCLWEWPVDAPMSQGFHAGHDGIDLAASYGTPIHSASSGTVTVAGYDNDPGGYGNYIQVEADSGETIQYGHVSEVDVSAGDRVDTGQIIGATGNAGSSTGPHLHFRIHDANGNAVDPAAYLNGMGACDTGATDAPAPAPAPEPAPETVVVPDVSTPDPVVSDTAPVVPDVSVTVDSSKTHVVVEGDTLFDIGAAQGLSWQDVWGMNPSIVNPDLIFPGDVIQGVM